MASRSKPLALVSASLVAGLTLGSMGVASAAPGPFASIRPPAKSIGSPVTKARRRGVDPLATVVASLTATDVADVTAARIAGKSFGEIAQANGVRSDTVVAVATSRASAELAAAVRAGRLAPHDGRQIATGLRARLMAQVAQTGSLRS